MLLLFREAVEFLVVASGLFNTPARPAWASLEALDVQAAAGFTGQVLDARDFTDAEAARVSCSWDALHF